MKSTANWPAALSRPRLKIVATYWPSSKRTLRTTRSGRVSGCLQTGEVARSERIVFPRRSFQRKFTTAR